MTKGEIPVCTVFVVVAALVCHILVLVGNLETAQTLHALGESSSGWSDVGLSLGGSLHHELDHLMHVTVTKLTGALNTIIEVETSIDHVLGSVASATDNSLATLQRSADRPRPADVSLALPETTGPKSALLKEHRRKEQGCMGINCGFPESELTSLLQNSAELCSDKSCGFAGEELSSLLQGKVQMQLMSSQVEGADDKQEQSRGGPVEDETRAALHADIEMLVEQVKAGIHNLLKELRPALLQVGHWLTTMGPKMQVVIEEFSIVIDRVQKIMDEVMAKIAGAGTHSKLLLHNVFAIFDVDESGHVDLDDVHKVSILYGFTALQHMKGEKLLRKYDANKDSRLSKQEFSLMVSDQSIPNAPTTILRTYSRKLAEVAGAVAAARQRDEIAHSVVQYFTLVCAKNRQKVSWVSQALTDGSLPTEFVADVLKQFAQNVDHPGMATVVDVGGITIKEMVKLNAHRVNEALKLIADPKWWHNSGFDPVDQPKLFQRVSTWVSKAGGHTMSPQLLQVLVGGTANSTTGIPSTSLVELAHESVRSSVRRFTEEQRLAEAKEFDALMSSDTSIALFRGLLGRVTPVRAGTDLDVARVTKAGVHAKPETLTFARALAKNASDTARYFQHLCFEHGHTSSNTVDSLATQIQGMLKKTQNFLSLLQQYSTPHGMDALEHRFNLFMKHALHEITGIVDKKIDASVANLGSHLPDAMLTQKGESVQGVWKDVIRFTTDLKSMLPTVIGDMKFAKREVSAVSANMLLLFPVFKTKGAPLFETAESLYKVLWIVYFVIFSLLSLGVLWYGFWASGYFGGPAPQADEAVPPTTLKDRCLCCFRACGTCFDRCPDTNLCFWSAILCACSIVLIMFILSTVLTLLSGLKLWVSSGCDEVYMLNDNSICVATMRGIQHWLNTFWSKATDTPLESMCMSRTLMTCGAISSKLKQSAVFTAGGSLLAALFTSQMIFESARLHEKARWLRVIEEKTVELTED